MGCRRDSRLLRLSKFALDLVELGLALDGEQGDFPATARLALERAAIERRPVAYDGAQWHRRASNS
jgi:hypothetical protein